MLKEIGSFLQLDKINNFLGSCVDALNPGAINYDISGCAGKLIGTPLHRSWIEAGDLPASTWPVDAGDRPADPVEKEIAAALKAKEAGESSTATGTPVYEMPVPSSSVKRNRTR